VPASCEPKLSPIRDNDDFILLRCDANCFHLVLPFLSMIALKKDGQREEAARELRIAQRLNHSPNSFSRASCFFANYGI
jgi:hypothetical protein